jgi:hypothetical protein
MKKDQPDPQFVQFVMMHAQNVLFMLGKIPHPSGRATEPNLQAAKLLIDQMEMIQRKTTGNLEVQEAELIENVLSEIRLAFVEVSGGTLPSMMPTPGMHSHDDHEHDEHGNCVHDHGHEEHEHVHGEHCNHDHEEEAEIPAPEAKPADKKKPSSNDDDDKRKYFKSYG